MSNISSLGRFWPLALVISCLSNTAGATDLQLLSKIDPAQGPPPGGGGDSWAPLLSPDGRFVLFTSTANNLMLASNNSPIPLSFPAILNVFLRDRQSATTTLVSVNLTGVSGGNGDSLPADLSTNGRYALFVSSASDLVPSDTNNITDIFVRDLVSGATILVSANTNGVAGNGVSRSPAMTPDGRYVAFVSDATDLVPGDTNQMADVFVRDLQAGTTMLASVGSVTTNVSFPAGICASESPVISADGRYVAFFSTATNLVPGTPQGGDVYVRDLVGGTTTWASASARTVLQTNQLICFNPALSADGQFVAFESGHNYSSFVAAILRYGLGTGLTDLVHTNAAISTGSYDNLQNLDMSPDGRFIAFVANTNNPPGNTTSCILLWDATAGTTSLISGNTNGLVPTNSVCDQPRVTADGRFVAFVSNATNLTTNPLIGDYHLYLRDTQAGTTTLLDPDTNGVGSLINPAVTLRITPDGELAAFDCGDGNLVANDRNRGSDIFLRDLTSGTVAMISIHDPGLPTATPNGATTLSSTSISTDGRFIAFASDADNLTPNDTNGCSDVFVRDLALGTTVLVSANTNGWSGDAVSFDPAISPDGRFVAFTSGANDLVSSDTNRAQDVFLRDLQMGTTTLVSINSAGTGPGNNNSYSPVVSAGGRYVLFRSQALNLAAVSNNGSYPYLAENLFVRNLHAGVTYALTTNGQSGFAAMTPDGHYIALGAPASTLGPLFCYLYLWNSQTASFISTNSFLGTNATSIYGIAITPDGRRMAIAGNPGLYLLDNTTGNGLLLDGGTNYHQDPCFSANGLWLACAQGAPRIAPLNGTNQIFLYDLQDGVSNVVSHGLGTSTAATGDSRSPAISADGRFVAYRSSAIDLVSGVTNGQRQVFLYDRQTGSNALLSADQLSGSSPNNLSLSPVFSGDGETLAFASWASDLVSDDFNQNSDIFAYTFLDLTLVTSNGPGQGPWLTWPWVPGKNYRLEFKGELTDPGWTSLGGNWTNLGTKAWLQDPAPATGQRFYRVVAY